MNKEIEHPIIEEILPTLSKEELDKQQEIYEKRSIIFNANIEEVKDGISI